VKGPDPVGHLLLYHAYNLVNDMPVFKDAEKDLAGDIIGKVSDYGSRFDKKGCDIIF
jgi:hypothetical protein